MERINPALKRHFEKPYNAGILGNYNYRGKDSSLKSGVVVIYYGLIKNGKIKDISFRTFGCSYSIAASSLITSLAKGRDVFQAALIGESEVEKKLGPFPGNKKDSLYAALGAFYDMLSSYISTLPEKGPGIKGRDHIAVAMSGGLDSSMTALILKNSGFDVTGITMKILPDGATPQYKMITSKLSYDMFSARRVCDCLGIPHFIADLSASFKKKIIDGFCGEYMQGRTPNPCVECNKYMKFGILLDISNKLGAGHIATGHYCRVGKQITNSLYTVRKGRDPLKDQSYVFWKLDQSQLEHIKTPLGDYTKEEIREKSRRSLPFLEKRDESQDICFIPGDRYHEFLKDRIEDVGTGKIIDRKGNTIGEHRGFPYYTIGQRKGLGISHEKPLYVTGIIPGKNIIIAGEEDDLFRGKAFLKDVNFIAGSPPAELFSACVKIRYNSPPVEARIITGENSSAEVLFRSPARSVTPGQSAVFYDGDTLLGGGIIEH